MIRNYKKNDLKSGFVGVRVAVSVGGKLKQKWFANSLFAQPTAMRLAEDLENKWLGMQLQHQRNNVISIRSNTGFVGLHFTYEENIKKNGKRYYYPVIIFQHTKHSQLTSAKWRIPKNLQISTSQWQDICLFIKNVRTLTFKTYESMINNSPDSAAYFCSNLK